MKNTKIAFVLSAALIWSMLAVTSLQAQDIKLQKDLKSTSVKNQANSGTCWSFALVSMIESELLRAGEGEFDLSEMYYVRLAYLAKAERLVRLQGHLNFSGGGQGHDVLDAWKTGGAVPDQFFTGLTDGAKNHDHSEMDAFLEAVMETVVNPDIENPDYKWRTAIDSILGLYLGKTPEEFDYKGKKYTPLNFAASLDFNPDNYIEITSFTHHPYYSSFVLEVPDNWSSGSYYNIPLEELMQIMENSISNGYTFAWDGDVSGDVSFSSNNGVAKLGNDDAKVSPELRQEAFDNFTTTDDHLMHITGIGADETGKKYFLTKNSWGDNKGNKGYWWLSENFIRMNTICILVHKEAVPPEIAAKMKLK